MTSEYSCLYLGSIPVREAWSLLQERELKASLSPSGCTSTLGQLITLCLWAAAPNLSIRGQQRHGFGMARPLAKFLRLCQRVSCPHPLLLSEEVMKARHNFETALTEG